MKTTDNTFNCNDLSVGILTVLVRNAIDLFLAGLLGGGQDRASASSEAIRVHSGRLTREMLPVERRPAVHYRVHDLIDHLFLILHLKIATNNLARDINWI